MSVDDSAAGRASSSLARARGQSLLGRVFDAYQNMMQIAACIDEVARQRAVARPRVLELSRRPTDVADYVPRADVVRYATHAEHQPTLSMPVALPFPDGAFDCCLVTDVYEHLPAPQRPSLLSEMLRVTDGLVMVAAPHADPVVSRFDRMAFDFVWGKYGERFAPLEQHDAFGLEPLDQTLASLAALGASRVVALPCNYVYRWIHQILIYFDLQHRQPHWDLFEPLNRAYNERLARYDYREPCYRYLIAVAAGSGVDTAALVERLTGPRETPAGVAEADGVLVETFRAVESDLADRLRQAAAEREQLERHNAWAVQQIAHLRAIAQALQRDNAWALGEIARLTAARGDVPSAG